MLDSIVCLIILLVAGYDWYLYRSDKPTISEIVQRLFATKVDLIIGGALAVALMFLPLHRFLTVLIAIVIGHVFWPLRETHK